MTPAEAIAALDRQLAAHGQNVKLRKTNSATDEVTVRAFVRGPTANKELAGLLKQGEKMVTVSPTGIVSFGNPSSGQFVVVDGRPRSIQGEPEFVLMDGTMVRINMTVTG